MKIDIGKVKNIKIYCSGCKENKTIMIGMRLEFESAIEIIEMPVKQAKSLIDNINNVIEKGCKINAKNIKIS